MLRKICCSAVLVLFVFITGCSENSMMSFTEKTVTGKVYGVLHQALPNIKILIDNQYTFTSSDGSFRIDKVLIPYNLILIDSVNRYGNYYKNISITNLEINTYNSFVAPKQCNLTVTIPTSLANKSGKIIFTNGNDINSFYPLNGASTSYDVNLPDNNQVRGKLIVLLYIYDNNSRITSYENFGMKDSVTLTAGSNVTVNLNESDLSLNPGETNVTGTITGASSNDYKFFYLNFGKRTTPNFSTNIQFESFSGNNFNLVLPTNLPISYSTLVFVTGNLDTISTYTRQFLVPNGGSGIQLNVESSPTLISPPNYSLDVDSNTTFTFSGVTNGVYIVSVRDALNEYSYNVYLTMPIFSLTYLTRIFYVGIANKTFTWQVEMNLPSANGLNDLLNPESGNFDKVRNRSSVWYFTTRP